MNFCHNPGEGSNSTKHGNESAVGSGISIKTTKIVSNDRPDAPATDDRTAKPYDDVDSAVRVQFPIINVAKHPARLVRKGNYKRDPFT